MTSAYWASLLADWRERELADAWDEATYAMSWQDQAAFELDWTEAYKARKPSLVGRWGYGHHAKALRGAWELDDAWDEAIGGRDD